MLGLDLPSCQSFPVRINILEAKNRLSQLVKAAQSGEDVVIANRGVPVARLVQIPQSPRLGRDLLRWLHEHPLPEHAQRSSDEIDAAIAAERDAWA